MFRTDPMNKEYANDEVVVLVGLVVQLLVVVVVLVLVLVVLVLVVLVVVESSSLQSLP